jgi:hypothetical protein
MRWTEGIRPADTASIDAMSAAAEMDGNHFRPGLTEITQTTPFRCPRQASSAGH